MNENNNELTTCPQCSSDDISIREAVDSDSNESNGIKVFGIPLSPPAKTFQCGKCDFSWEEKNSLLNTMSLLFVIFFVAMLILLFWES
jgi:hypothetical protein